MEMANQHSSFLDLPGELRNKIYEHAMASEPLDVNLITGATRIPGLVSCGQIRTEFEEYHKQEAHRHATRICLHTVDFANNIAEAPGNIHRQVLDIMSDDSITREISVRCLLTNDLEKHLGSLIGISNMMASMTGTWRSGYRFDLRWNDDFETQKFFNVVAEARRGWGGSSQGLARRGKALDKAVNAFQECLKRRRLVCRHL